MKQREKEIELQLEGTFLITLVYEFMGFQGVKEEKKNVGNKDKIVIVIHLNKE